MRTGKKWTLCPGCQTQDKRAPPFVPDWRSRLGNRDNRGFPTGTNQRFCSSVCYRMNPRSSFIREHCKHEIASRFLFLLCISASQSNTSTKKNYITNGYHFADQSNTCYLSHINKMPLQQRRKYNLIRLFATYKPSPFISLIRCKWFILQLHVSK